MKCLTNLASNPLAKFYTKTIRHPETNRMTRILNVTRFLYIEPLSDQRVLPRLHTCAGPQCKIFHLVSQKKLQIPCAQTVGKPDTIEHDVLLMRRVKFANKRAIYPGKRIVLIPNNRNTLHLVVDQRMCFQIFIHVNWIYICRVNHKSAEHAF